MYGSACRRVVTTGEALRRQLIGRLGLNEAQVVSIPTGIDLGRFNPANIKSARPSLGIPQDAFVFGIAATLRSWKGHQHLLDAFQQLAVDHPGTKVVVGDGPQRAPLEARIAASGFRERIHLVGHREDVPEVLAAMDCFVLPSYANEGIPQAIMQAMAMGLAVISTRIGAEAVVESETGVFVPPQEPKALAGAMLALAQDPVRRGELGAAGRRIAEQKFSLERMLVAMESVFQEAAS